MKRMLVNMGVVIVILGLVLTTREVLAAKKIEGKVADVKMTVCSAMSGKPGMCEGTLTIRTADPAGKMEVMVTRDVKLLLDGKQVLLPVLQGTMAKVSYLPKNGKKIATAVEAKSVKKQSR